LSLRGEPAAEVLVFTRRGNLNKMTAVASYTYDVENRMKTAAGVTYSYHALYQLTQVAQNSSAADPMVFEPYTFMM
jgi:hypothetical protein